VGSKLEDELEPVSTDDDTVPVGLDRTDADSP